MKLRLLLLLLSLFGATLALAAETEIIWTYPEKAPLGQPFMVSLRSDTSWDKVTIQWRGKTYEMLSEDGVYRTLLGTSLEDSLKGQSLPLRLNVTQHNKLWSMEGSVTMEAYNYPEEHLKVEPAMVSPPKKFHNRIAQERAAVKAVWTINTPVLTLPAKMQRPVPGPPTSRFGKRRVYNGVKKGFHSGLDLRAPTGTPVKALMGGEVVLTGDHYFAGKSIYVNHGGGVVSFYMHLSDIKVTLGQFVGIGDVIALSGKTGRVTGPHLHLGLALNGRIIDPSSLIGEAPTVSGTDHRFQLKLP